MPAPLLEDTCPLCCGEGFIKTTKKLKSREKEICRNCFGRGKIPTQFGLTLIQFLIDYTPWSNDISCLQQQIINVGNNYKQND